MKTKLQTITLAFSMMFLLTECDENKIEFEVKADFTIDVNVTTASINGEIVSSFEVESEIDLSDKIDQIQDISSLLVTGVQLQLIGYLPYKTTGLADSSYFTDHLTGTLKVTLLSNSNNKEIFNGVVDLGTNQAEGGSSSANKNAPLVVLSITPTEAQDLIENNKVKLKISISNGVIRSKEFKLKMIAQTKAITAI